MHDPGGSLYRSAYKKATTSLTAVLIVAVLVNLLIGLLFVWPEWRHSRSAASALAAREAAQRALAAQPIVDQATDRQIDSLLTALPLRLQLAAITKELLELADDAHVVFVKLTQDQQPGQPGQSAASSGTAGSGSGSANASAGSASTSKGTSSAGTSPASPGALVPHLFQTTVYGDQTSLARFLKRLSDSPTLFTVNQFTFAKLDIKQEEGDISSLLVKLPQWREGTPAYSLQLTLGVYTLPDVFQETFQNRKGGGLTALR
jgi:hypothetical protein